MNSTISFLGYSVRELNFSKNDYFKGGKINLDMKFTKNCTYLENNRVRINISVKLFDNAENDNYPFKLSFVTSGIFQYQDVNIEEDNSRELIEQKMLDILYPYIRMIVSNVLMVCNLPPLFLPTININQLVKDKESHSIN
ncbi:MAG TPA: protein-export chaperone SecB [Haloplasmataceae bacterium]